jgi:hypothetical protein
MKKKNNNILYIIKMEFTTRYFSLRELLIFEELFIPFKFAATYNAEYKTSPRFFQIFVPKNYEELLRKGKLKKFCERIFTDNQNENEFSLPISLIIMANVSLKDFEQEGIKKGYKVEYKKEKEDVVMKFFKN